MATKLLSLGALSQVKAYVDQEAAKAYRSASYTESTRTISFFKTTDGTGEAAFSITLPEDVDISGLIPKVENAVANDVAVLAVDGTVTDSNIAISALAKSADLADVATTGEAKDVSVSTITNLSATTVQGAIAELQGDIDTLNGSETTTGSVAKTVKDAVDALDGTVTGEGNFVKTISQTDGKITATLGGIEVSDVPDLTLAKITDAGTVASKDVATVEIGTDGEVASAIPTVAQVKKFVEDEVADLEGATHFLGKFEKLEDVVKPEAGDIVLVGAKEYIYDKEGNWVEIGDETVYVLKTTTIAGVDLQNDITKEELQTALNIADGAQINILEGVQVNGTDLAISDKKVNVTVASGTANGTIAVNGIDVAITGLDGAAYKAADYYMVAADYEIATEAEIKNVFGLA